MPGTFWTTYCKDLAEVICEMIWFQEPAKRLSQIYQLSIKRHQSVSKKKISESTTIHIPHRFIDESAPKYAWLHRIAKDLRKQGVKITPCVFDWIATTFHASVGALTFSTSDILAGLLLQESNEMPSSSFIPRGFLTDPQIQDTEFQGAFGNNQYYPI